MFIPGTPAFLATPSPSGKRTLVEGRVAGVDATTIRLAFPPGAGLLPGVEVTLFAQVHGKFFQHPAVVVAADPAALPDLQAVPAEFSNAVAFALTGEAVSAEQRQAYRAAAITLLTPVQCGGEAGTALLADVAAEGLGIIGPRSLPLGSSLDVSLTVDGIHVNGRMRVQSVKPLAGGRYRTGLHLPGRGTADRRRLELLAGHVQRMQLRRISGAA